jgi:REP element-mobilizing transposase RayT
MPDHLHLLAEATREDADLKRFTTAAKQLSGYYFKQARGERLWQRYGYEHVLRHEESTPAVVKYIVENPIRARLAAQPLDYPFWGSFVWSREELLEFIARAA